MSVPEKYHLNYGQKSETFYLPADYRCQLLQPKNTSLQLEENDIFKIRFNNPLASKKLEDILKSDDRILIVVPDKTRVARLDLVFPHIFYILEKNKISDKQVSILFANGAHESMTEDEKYQILKDAAYHRFMHYQHDCKRDMVDELGKTSKNTPVLVNHLLAKHTKIIVISSVVHHYFAGFGGGPKMIVPGLAAHETIWHNHRMAVLAEKTPLDPACEPGKTINNPVYEDILEAVKMREVDFAIQVVLDKNNQLVDAFCGDLYSSFQKASSRVHQLNAVKISELADMSIASVGGYPKDVNLVQAHKAIHHAVRSLKPNGILIVLAECRDGWGSEGFPSWFEFEPYNEMKRAVMENYQLNGNTALVLKHKLDNYRIYLISELPIKETSKMGFYTYPKLDVALETAKNILPEDALTYIIPNASITLPTIE